MKQIKKKILFAYFIFFSLVSPFSQENTENEDKEILNNEITLFDAISVAVDHNYDIRKQQQSVAIAKGKLLQAQGELDVSTGLEGSYNYAQNPVDPRDPNYLYGYSFTSPNSVYGIFSKNSLTNQGSGSIFIQKLFSFGLQSKLSYTLQRNHNKSEYDYDSSFSSNTYQKYKDEHGRNLGDLSLELNLPLFKSFNSSITALQIGQAQDYLQQMIFQLNDTISKTIINTTKAFWAYYLAYENLAQLNALQVKLTERNANIGSMVKAGILMKNDILIMQVGVISNQKSIDQAQVEYLRAKMELANMMGIKDVDSIEKPTADMPNFTFENIENFPSLKDIDEELLAYIEENRIDFRILKNQLESAKKDIKIAKVNGLPDANLQFKLGMNGTTYSDDFSDFISAGFWNVRGVNVNGSLGFSIKPYDRNTKGKVMEAQANYDSLMVDYEKNKSTLYLDVRNSIEKLTLYHNSLLRAEESFNIQKQLYENEQARFKAGLIKVDNLIEQDQKFIQAMQDRYQTLVNYLEALLEYKYATASLVYVDTDSLFLFKESDETE